MTTDETLLRVPPDAVMPATRPRRLRQLSEKEYAFWRANGYVAVEKCVPLEICREASKVIQEFVGAEQDWYANEKDIYSDVLPSGKRPCHGPCGMVQMSHHDSLWRLRQCPQIHGAFADCYGTEKLWVTCDRAHFKPPQNDKHPIWNNAGPVHTGLHWDVSVDSLPVPMAIQGVVYLEDTFADQGPLHVVPGSFHQLASLRHQRQTQGSQSFANVAVPVVGKAGTLVMWHSATLHGPGRNLGALPRISAYVAMLPVDATDFQPPGVRPTAPLSLGDAGTLAYMDDTKRCTLTRLNRNQRLQRWRKRLPLLDEDPKEEELEKWPPGEVQAPPFSDLSPLGRKLVGLDEW